MLRIKSVRKAEALSMKLVQATDKFITVLTKSPTGLYPEPPTYPTSLQNVMCPFLRGVIKMQSPQVRKKDKFCSPQSGLHVT